jgi:hypothetical protein
MANRGPLAAVLIVDPIYAGRANNASGNGAAALPPLAFGDGAGTNGGALAGAVVLTVANLLTGFYRADANGANRTVTLPSFADLTNETSGVCKGIGDRFEFLVYNAGAANNLVVTGVANVTVITADATDATAPPAHLVTVSLVRVSATDIVAACNLFGP